MGSAPAVPVDAIAPMVQWARGLRYGDIPEQVIDSTKRRILDLAAAALAGTQAEGIPALLQLVDRWGGRPTSTILGTDIRTSLPLSVLINATIARALELDDVHERALLHPTVATAPIALGIAELDATVTSKRLLAALVASQEVLCRLGLAPDYHVSGPLHRPRGWSFTYQCGILGGALVGALLRGLDEQRTLDALGNAYAALSGNQQPIQEAVLAIRVQQGIAAQTSVQSVDLAEAGITGPHQILEGTFGWLTFWHGGAYDRNVLVEGLGDHWEVSETSVKPYPVCRITHNAIDATITAVRDAGVAPDGIDRLVVHVNSQESWDEVVHPLERRRAPTSPMDAQFSLPYACAVAAVHGTVTLQHLTDDAVRDATVLSVAHRVEPVLDPGHDGVVGRVIPMPVTVDLHTRDGRVVTRHSRVPTGHPERALGWDAIEEKVRACAQWGGQPAASQLIDEVITAIRALESHQPGTLLRTLSSVRTIPA